MTRHAHANERRNQFLMAMALSGVIGLLGALATLVWMHVLPEQYFYDGESIRSLLATELRPMVAFDTFVNTAWVFSLIGFNSKTSREITAISVFLLAFLPTIIWLFSGLGKLKYWNVVLFSAWIFVASVYLGQLTKEVIALWFISLILFVIGLKRPLTWLAFILPILYAIAFRPYWILIAFFWLLFWWLSYRRWTLFLKIAFSYLAMVGVSVIYYIYSNEYITEIRNQINESRLGSDVAQSTIANLFPNYTVLHDTLNWGLSWLLILFPVPVLRQLEFMPIASFFLVVFTVLTVLSFAKRIGIYLRDFSPSQERRVQACLTFMLAFTLIQAVFEPDYGSALKHMTDLLPMLTYVLFIEPKGAKKWLTLTKQLT